MAENFEIYEDYCFMNHIYFYPFTRDCPGTYCRLAKFVNGERTDGKKLYRIIEVEKEIQNLYKAIYLKNNPVIIHP